MLSFSHLFVKELYIFKAIQLLADQNWNVYEIKVITQNPQITVRHHTVSYTMETKILIKEVATLCKARHSVHKNIQITKNELKF